MDDIPADRTLKRSRIGSVYFPGRCFSSAACINAAWLSLEIEGFSVLLSIFLFFYLQMDNPHFERAFRRAFGKLIMRLACHWSVLSGEGINFRLFLKYRDFRRAEWNII